MLDLDGEDKSLRARGEKPAQNAHWLSEAFNSFVASLPTGSSSSVLIFSPCLRFEERPIKVPQVGTLQRLSLGLGRSFWKLWPFSMISWSFIFTTKTFRLQAWYRSVSVLLADKKATQVQMRRAWCLHSSWTPGEVVTTFSFTATPGEAVWGVRSQYSSGLPLSSIYPLTTNYSSSCEQLSFSLIAKTVFLAIAFKHCYI